MHFVEHAVKLATTTSRRIDSSKRQISEALCTIAREKEQWIGKNTTSQEKLLMPVNKIKAVIAICISLTVFFL